MNPTPRTRAKCAPLRIYMYLVCQRLAENVNRKCRDCCTCTYRYSAPALLQMGTHVCMGSKKNDARRKKSEQRHNICMNHLVCVVLKIVNVKITSQSPGAQTTRIIVTCLIVPVAFREQYQKQLLSRSPPATKQFFFFFRERNFVTIHFFLLNF